MELFLSENEVKIIKIWADSTIHGGHWGDNDLILPEENIILGKLESVRDGKIELTGDEAKIVLTWSESSHGIHTMEEESAIKKLESIITEDSRVFD